MKYTIEGFNQAYAMTLKKEIEINGKIVTRKVDCTDLVILRWLVDFYPNMRSMEVDGERYVMVTFGKLQADLPMLDISKRAFSERLQKLADFGVLKYKFIKEGGTFALYALGENYVNLIASPEQGVCGQTHTGMRSNDNGVCGQTHTKDYSIINTSILNKRKEEEAHASKSIDDVIAEQDIELQEPLQDFVKMRKAIKKPITTKGLELAVKKLRQMAKSTAEAIEIINQSIMNSWQSFYPLHNDKGNKQNIVRQGSTQALLDSMSEEKRRSMGIFVDDD